MRAYLNKIKNRYRNFWTRRNLSSLGGGVAIFAVALIIQHFADKYVSTVRVAVAGDLILDHIPTLDVDFFIVQGALILSAIIVALALVKPKYINFTVKTLSLFMIIRSLSISLTHLGVNPHSLAFDTNSWGYGLYNILFKSQNDLFFSGHTGIPFLMGLIFWHEKIWRYVFMIASGVFAVSVLLAHVHYSIDVFASPFITYGIFSTAKYMWGKDFDEITLSNVP